MSDANPAPAIDAFVGKVYEWKGYTFRASMRLFVALEKAGLPTATLANNSLTATLVGIYALTQPAKKVELMMASGALVHEAIAFGDACEPAEIEQASAIVGDVITRYFGSIATYKSEGNEGNGEAAAVSS